MTPMRSNTIPPVRVSCTQIRTALLLLALAALGNPVRAQAPPPAATATEMRFDVASIKPNRETFEEHFIRPASNGQSSFSGVRTMPGGRLQASWASIRPLITRAFEISPLQLEGGPSWLEDDKYDIDATAGREATTAELNAMLRTLLAERFKLRTHVVTRQVPVYAITVARSDGRLGPNLKPTSPECVATLAGRQPGERPPLPPPGAADIVAPTCGLNWVGGGSAGRRLSWGGTTMAGLVNYLKAEFDGPVEDRTGLSGNFDVILEYESTVLQRAGRAPVGDPSTAPTLRDALQNQLGLKVEKSTGPLAITVIDAIERPSPD